MILRNEASSYHKDTKARRNESDSSRTNGTIDDRRWTIVRRASDHLVCRHRAVWPLVGDHSWTDPVLFTDWLSAAVDSAVGWNPDRWEASGHVPALAGTFIRSTDFIHSSDGDILASGMVHPVSKRTRLGLFVADILVRAGLSLALFRRAVPTLGYRAAV